MSLAVPRTGRILIAQLFRFGSSLPPKTRDHWIVFARSTGSRLRSVWEAGRGIVPWYHNIPFRIRQMQQRSKRRLGRSTSVSTTPTPYLASRKEPPGTTSSFQHQYLLDHHLHPDPPQYVSSSRQTTPCLIQHQSTLSSRESCPTSPRSIEEPRFETR
ncbi:hypothetical protein JAAARDRAFT_430882 [Jaapia argillacea MUCL 33604]|uniref:Uncharacterized protein n=1 Tax=Jaapia argillacea MUCL 33604 TaxID=933084 RepID=A0A067PPP9_9AGAM|nr:hypothetical protein JAAARDRAFT_430882 [Jaapia argillacea MUCL 33604]